MQQSGSDTPTQKQPASPVGNAVEKVICGPSMGIAGDALGNAIVPGVGGALLAAIGPKSLLNQ